MENATKYKKEIEKIKKDVLKLEGYEENTELWRVGIKIYYLKNSTGIIKLLGYHKEHNDRRFSSENGQFLSQICNLSLNFYYDDNLIKIPHLRLKNYTYPYIIYLDNKGSYKKLLYNKVYNEKEIKNLFFVGIYERYISDYETEIKTTLLCYEKEKLIYEKQNVLDFLVISPTEIIYSEEYNNNYKIYRYDFVKNNEIFLGKTDNYKLLFNPNEQYHNYYCVLPKDNSIEDKEYVKFCFAFNESKIFYILFKHIMTADKIFIIENEFNDDFSINYQVYFKKNRVKDIEYMIYLLFYKNFDMSVEIYGYKLYTIMQYALFDDMMRNLTIQTDNKMIELFNIIDKLKNKHKFESYMEFLQYFSKKYGRHSLEIFSWGCNKDGYKKYIGKKKSFSNDLSSYKEYLHHMYIDKYNSDFNEIVSNNMLKTKWNSEQKVYRIVKSIFSDAIYQYKASWLGQQSLDIYVPSLRLGIEYQGLQHFKAIDYFGGEIAYNKNKSRDERKATLCTENDIILLYWNYDEDINRDIFLKKLKDIKVSSPVKISKDESEYEYSLQKFKNFNHINSIEATELNTEYNNWILKDVIIESMNNIFSEKDIRATKALEGLSVYSEEQVKDPIPSDILGRYLYLVSRKECIYNRKRKVIDTSIDEKEQYSWQDVLNYFKNRFYYYNGDIQYFQIKEIYDFDSPFVDTAIYFCDLKLDDEVEQKINSNTKEIRRKKIYDLLTFMHIDIEIANLNKNIVFNNKDILLCIKMPKKKLLRIALEKELNIYKTELGISKFSSLCREMNFQQKVIKEITTNYSEQKYLKQIYSSIISNIYSQSLNDINITSNSKKTNSFCFFKMFEYLFSVFNKQDNNCYYNDKQLENYGLENYQKKLVKKGEYDICNFEEEELEDDDYYNEDPF